MYLRKSKMSAIFASGIVQPDNALERTGSSASTREARPVAGVRGGIYLLLVRWDSVAAHEEGFRKSPEYPQGRKLLHHFYDPFPTALHYEAVAIGPELPG